MDKKEEPELSVTAVAYELEKHINRLLTKYIPPTTCPEKKPKVAWKREKVVEALVVRLGGVGPTLTK
jgi:hypothetical protein